MYDALVETREVQGILADIYTASYYMEKIDDPRLVISTILSSQRSIGLVIGHNENSEDLNKKGECLRKLFKYRQRDIKKIIFKHTRAFHVSWEIYYNLMIQTIRRVWFVLGDSTDKKIKPPHSPLNNFDTEKSTKFIMSRPWGK